MGKMKRRNYLIDPSFQMAFIFKFCIGVIIISLLIGGLVFVLTLNSTTVAIENTRVVVKPSSDFILPGLLLTVLIVAAFSALATFFSTLLLTHRIAGPVYRFKREVGFVKEGDLTRRFQIRRKDSFQDLAGALKEMTEELRNRHIELSSTYRSLLKYLQEKDFRVSSEQKEEFQQKLAKLESVLKRTKVE